jgi:tetratricopeptide (TPR) repeat protein
MTTGTEKSFLQKIWEKGFLQIIGSYLLGAWGILQFIDWLVNRYNISSSWIDIALVFFLALLPSVLLYTYFHNKGRNHVWHRLEKFVIPSNLVVALILAAALFSSKELTAKTEQIVITNEVGEQLERSIPKQKYVRRFLFLPAIVDNPNNDWMSLGLPLLQDQDLEQDHRFYGISPISIINSIQRYGYQFGDKLPLSIQQKLAKYNYSDFLVQMKVNEINTEFEISYLITDSKTGKTFFEQTYQDADYYRILDQFTEDLRKNLYPDQKFKGVDLPAGEIFSSNKEAFQYYAESYYEDDLKNDKEAAIELLNKAIALDPNFTAAYLNLAGAYQSLRKNDAMKSALEEAMNRIYVLPERMQLNLKYFYFRLVEEDSKKGVALLEMWRDLYPNDVTPYWRLISVHQDDMQIERAKQYAEEAIAAGHKGSLLTRLGYMYRAQGNLEKAESYFLTFMEEYPDMAGEAFGLGYIYRDKGELEKAREHFGKIQLLQPDNHNVYEALAGVEIRALAFDKALTLFEEALKKAKLTRDSADVYQNIEDLYDIQGQNDRAIELMNQRFEKLESKFLTIPQLLDELTWPDTYMRYGDCGRMEELKDRSDAYLKKYMPENTFDQCMTEMLSGLFSDNEEDLLEAFDKCGDTYMAKSSENEQLLGSAFFAEAKGDYDKAIALFEQFTNEIPDLFFKFRLANIYLKAEQPEKVEALLQKPLFSNPHQAKGAVLMAKAQKVQGDLDGARKWIDQALKVWENASPCYLPKKEAEAFRASLTELVD